MAYDGNGNVMALVNAADGTLAAEYDYGPFGEPIRIDGPIGKANPFRFSTKYDDDESDLLYYGYRYYKPSTGTWPNRDPLEDYAFGIQDRNFRIHSESAVNSYDYVNNWPVSKTDILGLATQKEEGAAAYAAAASKMKQMCTKCIKPQPCGNTGNTGNTTCGDDAQKIADAIVSKWNSNFGRGSNTGTDNVGGYLCWDWAEGFLQAAQSVKSKYWLLSIGHARRNSDMEVHFWIYLQAGYTWEGSGDRAKECTIMIDDGWFDTDYIHTPKWPDDPDWQIGQGTRGPLTSPPML